MPHRTVGIQFVRTKKKGKTKQQDMEKEKTYNEAIAGDEGFNEGEGYPSCEGQPCANVADESGGQSDIMTEDADSAQFAEAEKQAAEENTAETDGAETLRAEIDQWKDKFLRLQAEFDNYRKRTLKEKMELVQTGGRDVLLAMLPVHDDIARAVTAMEKSDDVEGLAFRRRAHRAEIHRSAASEKRDGHRGHRQGVRPRNFGGSGSVRRGRRDERSRGRCRTDGLHAG